MLCFSELVLLSCIKFDLCLKLWNKLLFFCYLQFLLLVFVPLTFSSVANEFEPASLVALQVYMPMWACDTAAMLRKLALGPAWDVTIPLFAPTMSPCKLQLMVRGRSPLVTIQETWTKSPSSKISLPKLKGRISGASAMIKEKNRALTFCSTFSKEPSRTLSSARPSSQFLLSLFIYR